MDGQQGYFDNQPKGYDPDNYNPGATKRKIFTAFMLILILFLLLYNYIDWDFDFNFNSWINENEDTDYPILNNQDDDFPEVITPPQEEIDIKERDIVAYWSFDEGESYIFYDNSNYSNHGYVRRAKWSEGIYNKALEFDGINDYELVSDNNALNFQDTNEFTISLWIKREGSLISKNEGLISKGTGVYNRGYNIGICTNDTLHFSIKNRISNYNLFSNTEINDKAWHHIVAVWNGNSQYLYIDGRLDNFAYLGNVEIYDDTKPFEFGNHWGYTDNNHPYHGLIDEVKVFNYALNDNKIADL